MLHLFFTLSARLNAGHVKQIGMKRPREMSSRLVEFFARVIAATQLLDKQLENEHVMLQIEQTDCGAGRE